MQIFYMVVFVCGLVLVVDFVGMYFLNNEVTQTDRIVLSRRGWTTLMSMVAVMVVAGLLATYPPPDVVYSAIGLLLFPFVKLVQLVGNAVGIDSNLLESLGMTEYAAWVRESLWGWPLSLTFHAFGNAIVVGLIFIIGLRFVGVFRTDFLHLAAQVLSGHLDRRRDPGRERRFAVDDEAGTIYRR